MLTTVADCNCDLTNIVVVIEYIVSRFFKYYLFIKKTLSFTLSAVCFDIYKSNVEAFKLTTVCKDVAISVKVTIILSVNSKARFNLSFVARFSVSNSTINFENNVILRDKAFVDDSAVVIDDLTFNLLFLTAFFDLEFDCRLKCMILLLG